MKPSGLTAIVTGGGSGLGAATAYYLSKQGAKVAIFDYAEDKAKKIADDCGGMAFKVDVGDSSQVDEAVTQVTQQLGAARIVVNCAGIAPAARMVGREDKLSIDLFQQVIRVNLMGSYHVMSYALRDMIKLEDLEGEERGVIINTSSTAYQDGQVGQTAYAASKGGIAAMCLPAARELARHGVRVCAIAPGLFNTPMMESLPEETTQAIISNVPFPNRLGNPQEYAELATHIIENRYLNGEVIRLDGATRLPPR